MYTFFEIYKKIRKNLYDFGYILNIHEILNKFIMNKAIILIRNENSLNSLQN